jgi:hypothetical protein
MNILGLDQAGIAGKITLILNGSPCQKSKWGIAW